ncbi:radical SAM protein [Altererythrobacter salegens]|uniref:Radical SAM protein n=1 Tax=Croceibacterium salegens TaxID=1737568 RepID=A0A6I4SXE4_9SPHN|nr:radical SAM protein [Croceibacterium salegens]MXO60695.1 radical SAM protein [Croceibacterium salegens]
MSETSVAVANAASTIRRKLTSAMWRVLPGKDRAAFVERPFELHLEFTNLCNANCVFCPYHLQERPHENMDDEVFQRAVSQFVAFGGGSVGLTPIVGDALIHPKFLERVRYLRSIPQIDRITLTTNAILLDRHGVEEVLDAGLLRINIRVAGFDAEMYRRVYLKPGYKKVRDNVAQLYELNAKRADPVPLFLCLRPDRPWEEVAGHPDFKPFLQYDLQIDYIDVFSRSGGLVGPLPEGMTQMPEELHIKRKPCAFTYSGLVVLSNGDVQVCICESSVNAPALIVGNIREESLDENWAGERIRALRASFGNGTLNSNCAKCDYNYRPAEFHSPAMRKRAKDARRLQQGVIVRHTDPVTGVWQVE